MLLYRSEFLNKLEGMVAMLAYKRRLLGEYLNLWRKRKLIKKISIDAATAARIKKLWKENYGKSIPLYWHRLYASYTGTVDINYFPEIYYSVVLERYYNNPYVALAVEDKSLLDLKLRLPGHLRCSTIPLIIFRSQSHYYDSGHKLISEQRALELVANCGKSVIKPSTDSDSGRGVIILNCHGGIDLKSGLSISDVIQQYKNDFVIQPFIQTHKAVSGLNPSSVNTIRIITYILDDKVYHTPLAMRIGGEDSEVDNIHAGGMVIGISDKGELSEAAFTEFGAKMEYHPSSGVLFKGYRIPGVLEAIDMVEESHLMFPHLTFISWDITINEAGHPIIVEMNTRNQSAWFPQMVNGKSLFGENTEKMIRLLRIKT